MDNINKDRVIETSELGKFIIDYRDLKAWSQSDLAEKLGVSRVTIARWEGKESKPSLLALKQLEKLISEDPRTDDSIRFDIKGTNQKQPVNSMEFNYGQETKSISPAPYVINGPKNQNSFHKKLIDLQQKRSPTLDWETYKTRLSLVGYAENNPTTQFTLESPRVEAKSWNSNYGSHGWHRYVGRFPPHLVRSLLNYFDANENDLICDPFAGSGTTLVESRLLGIPSIGIEICPLSCMISRTKATFPVFNNKFQDFIGNFEQFYTSTWDKFIKHNGNSFSHQNVIERDENNIKKFANIERWFTPDALLGVSIVTEFAGTEKGYLQDMILTALSAKMRSIGNVDVDVIRAEYSKRPREEVNVLKLVKNQLLKMVNDIESTLSSHKNTIAKKESVIIKQGSVLDTIFPKNSISHIITSPPYGVESLSYLRTHLLSYRSLGHFLKTDPYEFGNRVIGSEYLLKTAPDVLNFKVAKISPTYTNFFKKLYSETNSKNHKIRVAMMMRFFQDMNDLIDKFREWVKPKGKVAFVIGNKKIDNIIIPTDKIIDEIFKAKGFKLIDNLSHKLKTNNSNSKVPWQDRVIEQEFVMIFSKN